MDEENVVHMYNGILALKRNEIGLFVGMWMDLESVKQSDVPGFPGSLDGKASAYNAGDPDSIPGSGRSPREGNGNPL